MEEKHASDSKVQSIQTRESNGHITDYKVISGASRDLVERVRKNMEHGWQPLGGLAVIEAGGHPFGYYSQAMVRYGPSEQEVPVVAEKLDSKKNSKDMDSDCSVDVPDTRSTYCLIL